MKGFLSIFVISTLLLLLVFPSTETKPIVANKIQNDISKSSTLSPLQVHDEDLQVAQFNCEGTLYKQLCLSTLSSLFSGSLKSKSTTEILSGIVTHIIDTVKISSSECRDIKREGGFELGRRENQALDQCLDLSQDTILDLNHALSIFKSRSMSIKRYKHLNTLLSFAITNQQSCLEEFVSDGIIRRKIQEKLKRISNLVSISLAILEKIPKEKNKRKTTKDEVFYKMDDRFPSWFAKKERKLLSETKYDLVVARDGTGNYTSISEAVEVAPASSAKRFIIYI